MHRILAALTLLLALALPATAQIEHLLKSDTAPSGVVFEVVEGRQSALSWVLPRIERYSQQLRGKFPNIKIAVVTHGREQFGLVDSYTGEKAANIRRKALKLTETGTDLHVCGGHAKARGVSTADFPAHINVAASGPAQVKSLIAQGYMLVQIRK